MLQKFKVDQVTISENYKTCEVRITFILEGIPVSIPVNYGLLAQKYYPNGWHNLSEQKQKQSRSAAFAVIEDYLKAMLVMHQLSVMDVTEIFLPHLIGKDGLRMADVVRTRLPEFLEGKLLGDGQ